MAGKSLVEDTRKIFQYISYIQYPLMLVTCYYMFRPVFNNMENFWAEYNKALIFLGLAVGFSSLQDTRKTQNKISRIIFESPKYSTYFIYLVFFQTLGFIIFGLFGYFISKNDTIQEVSMGAFTFGMGLIGLLKSVIEMADNHRKEE